MSDQDECYSGESGMRIRILPIIVALSFILPLIVIASAPVSAQSPPINWGMKVIPAGQYSVIKNFIANGAQATITFEVQVIVPSGSRVDVLLMTKNSFDQYKTGATFFIYDAASKLDVSITTGTAAPFDLIDGTEYFLVIDNTNRPFGGGQGNTEVRVMYFIQGTDIQTVGEWFGILIAIAAIAVVVVVIIILVFVFLRRPRSMGQIGPQTYNQQYQQPWMKTCPHCGTQAPMEFAYCQKCGWRY